MQKNVVQLDLFSSGKASLVGLKDEPLSTKIERALRLLRSASAGSNEPLEVCYSGGKDSDVILELAKMAGISFRAIYKNTTIDPSGTIKHCLDNGVEIYRRKTFAQVIQSKGFPKLQRRFCCSELKEFKLLDKQIQGIRRAESIKRAQLYKEPTACRLYNKKERVEVFYPILYWTDQDVADFIKLRGIKCHHLYYSEDGRFISSRRLGCMGCPQASDHGLSDFKANPRLVRFWLRNGLIWWNTHKLVKTKKKFKDPYELFVYNLFFHDYQSFRSSVNGLFGSVDCKLFLERYFNISL